MPRHLKIIAALLLMLISTTSIKSFSQCNGCIELCAKRYDQVAYLTTHNSFNNSADDFTVPNQSYNITQQLEFGVRGLMIDVYDVDGTPTVYHGYAFLGSVPLVSNLNEIKSFLDNNPNEVVTIIFECYTNASSIEDAFTEAGLMDYLYEKLFGDDWLTLQELIDSNKRLVVFTDKNDASVSQKWYHFVWHHAVETHFSVSNLNNFSCDYNRGHPDNDLFIFNHFITPTFGIPQISTAEQANSNPFLINRALECWNENVKFPNFITVDFYHKGDCMEAVNTLNTMNSILNIRDPEGITRDISIYPSPAKDFLFVTGQKMYNIRVLNSKGQVIKNFSLNGNDFTINIQDIESGIYFIQIQTVSQVYIKRFLKI